MGQTMAAALQKTFCVKSSLHNNLREHGIQASAAYSGRQISAGYYPRRYTGFVSHKDNAVGIHVRKGAYVRDGDI